MSAPSTQAAMGLWIRWLLKYGPPPQRLTHRQKRELFDHLWAREIAEGFTPEEVPKLAPLGKSAVGKKSTSRGMPEQTPGMRSHDVRSEIKRQVWKAFDGLIVGAEK